MVEKNTSKIVMELFEFQNNIKMYHWRTTSYARHKAADELYDELIKMGDLLIEAMIVRHGRPQPGKTAIKIQDLNDNSVVIYIKKSKDYFVKLQSLFTKEESDLASIVDNILVEINKVLYLMTLS